MRSMKWIDQGQRAQALAVQSEACLLRGGSGACGRAILALVLTTDRSKVKHNLHVRPDRQAIAKQARENIAPHPPSSRRDRHLCSGTLLSRTKVCGKPGCRCAHDPKRARMARTTNGGTCARASWCTAQSPRSRPASSTGHRQPPQGQEAHASLGGADRTPHRPRSAARTLTYSRQPRKLRANAFSDLRKVSLVGCADWLSRDAHQDQK